jgi:redox-sensitive bicupin YhaK (pirin superfamily)
MITVRKSNERGHADHGWLKTFHTFSFADYYDPRFHNFRSLRVINEDRVAPGEGFGTHPHNDMEIITYVLEGQLQHRDSMGTGAVIRPGEVQRMSAGTGVTHSEFNASDKEPVHLLQIWIFPDKKGLKPSYEQKAFSEPEKRGKLKLVASQDAREGSVKVHQDVNLYATVLEPGEETVYDNPASRHAWIQVARGSLELNGLLLSAGDGAAVTGNEHLALKAHHKAEILLFDLN